MSARVPWLLARSPPLSRPPDPDPHPSTAFCLLSGFSALAPPLSKYRRDRGRDQLGSARHLGGSHAKGIQLKCGKTTRLIWWGVQGKVLTCEPHPGTCSLPYGVPTFRLQSLFHGVASKCGLKYQCLHAALLNYDSDKYDAQIMQVDTRTFRGSRVDHLGYTHFQALGASVQDPGSRGLASKIPKPGYGQGSVRLSRVDGQGFTGKGSLQVRNRQ
eukprot:901401-Rhodomonas_salina.4